MDLLVIGAKQKDFNLLPKNQINLKDFDYSMLGGLEFKQGDFISGLVSEDVFFDSLREISSISGFKDKKTIHISNHSPIREIESIRFGWEEVLHSKIHTQFVLMLSPGIKNLYSDIVLTDVDFFNLLFSSREIGASGNRFKLMILKQVKGEWTPLDKTEIVARKINTEKSNDLSEFKKSIENLNKAKSVNNHYHGRRKHSTNGNTNKLYKIAVRHSELKEFELLKSFCEEFRIKGLHRDAKKLKKRDVESIDLSRNKKRKSTGWKSTRRKKQWKAKDYKFDLEELHPDVFLVYKKH